MNKLDNQQLTLEDIVDNRGDFKTVFCIEKENENETFVHILGYAYYAGPGEDESKEYRLVTYVGLYVPLEEVLAKGLYKAELDNCEDAKIYIEDLDGTEVFDAYNNWTGIETGTYPVVVVDSIDANLPEENCYILR